MSTNVKILHRSWKSMAAVLISAAVPANAHNMDDSRPSSPTMEEDFSLPPTPQPPRHRPSDITETMNTKTNATQTRVILDDSTENLDAIAMALPFRASPSLRHRASISRSHFAAPSLGSRSLSPPIGWQARAESSVRSRSQVPDPDGEFGVRGSTSKVLEDPSYEIIAGIDRELDNDPVLGAQKQMALSWDEAKAFGADHVKMAEVIKEHQTVSVARAAKIVARQVALNIRETILTQVRKTTAETVTQQIKDGALGSVIKDGLQDIRKDVDAKIDVKTQERVDLKYHEYQQDVGNLQKEVKGVASKLTGRNKVLENTQNLRDETEAIANLFVDTITKENARFEENMNKAKTKAPAGSSTQSDLEAIVSSLQDMVGQLMDLNLANDKAVNELKAQVASLQPKKDTSKKDASNEDEED